MVEELYNNIGGDYAKAISRMNDDERIKKYLKFFIADESFSQLKEALNNNDCTAAFNAAHTLKGVCQNMSFHVLGNLTFDITEELRANNIEKAIESFKEIEKAYNLVLEEIKKII